MLVLLLCLGSCHTVRQAQTEYLTIRDTDTVRELRWQRDSIYIFEKETTTQSGDTIFIDRLHYEYRDKSASDTVRLVKTVTIKKRLYFTKEKEVNRLKWWQTVLMWSGGVLWLCAIVAGAWKIGKMKR